MGASDTFIDKDLAKEMGYEEGLKNMEVTMANGTKTVAYQCILTLKLKIEK